MNSLGEFHFKLRKGNRPSGKKRIVAIDTEWAKNWKAEEKVVPFCCSFHTIYLDDITDPIVLEDPCMESEMYFRSKRDSTQDYIDKVEKILSSYINEDTLFVGHQLSSDLHTFVQNSTKRLDSLSLLIESLRLRKNKNTDRRVLNVMDTRYDIKNRLRGNGGEKLRNVSLRCKVYAIQNELNEMSLTKMYNQYILDGDVLKREKLSVMNWRHSFQTSLICLLDMNPGYSIYNKKFDDNFLVTNDIMQEMGKDAFNYINSDEYNHSCTLEGIKEYCKKYNN